MQALLFRYNFHQSVCIILFLVPFRETVKVDINVLICKNGIIHVLVDRPETINLLKVIETHPEYAIIFITIESNFLSD